MIRIPIKFRTHCDNPRCFIKLTPASIRTMATNLYCYLWRHGLEIDTNIYFRQKNHWNRLSKDKPDDHAGKTVSEEITHKGHANIPYYITEDINPPIEYTGDTLCMTFEGGLYDEINYGNGKIEDQINNFFSHYGLYPEQGYAWSLAVYPL